jgi:hypothetical protein
LTNLGGDNLHVHKDVARSAPISGLAAADLVTGEDHGMMEQFVVV